MVSEPSGTESVQCDTCLLNDIIVNNYNVYGFLSSILFTVYMDSLRLKDSGIGYRISRTSRGAFGYDDVV